MEGMEKKLNAVDDREFSIETPIGTIASDSGNHFIDIISVLGVIIVLFIFKKIGEKIC